MFVDDEVKIVEIVKCYLSSAGYEVICCTDSSTALKLFARDPEKFDVIITDYTMPNMTGLELARKVRKIKSDIPLVLCSGNVDVFEKKAEMNSVFNDYLLKPVKQDTLFKVIRNLLN